MDLQTFGDLSFHVKRSQQNDAIDVLGLQARRWGLELSPDQVSQLERYAELLTGYELANVIGTRDYGAVLLEHVADALSCALTRKITAEERIIDVGAGGGLPGIPLRIAFPALRLTLLEATAKKARFLETAVNELELRNVEVINQRAEEAGRIARCRDSYDVAVARAVAALPVVVEYCAPFVTAGGAIIAMKGRPASKQLHAGARAAEAVGAKLETVKGVEFIPEMVQKERSLVVFRKTTRTPRRFPRRVGQAKQRPMGGEGGR